MKKKIECELLKINSVNDVSYDDYLLFKKLETQSKDMHPILGGWFLHLIGFILLGLGGWACFAAGINGILPIFLSFLIGVGIEGYTIYWTVVDIKECKELRKQCKQLKKAKVWEKLKAIMAEYETTAAYQDEYKTRTIAGWEASLVEKEIRLEEDKKRYEQTAEESSARISLLRKAIERAKAGEDMKQVIADLNEGKTKIDKGEYLLTEQPNQQFDTTTTDNQTLTETN